MKTTIEAMKQWLSALESQFGPDIATAKSTLKSAISREEAQNVEPVWHFTSDDIKRAYDNGFNSAKAVPLSSLPELQALVIKGLDDGTLQIGGEPAKPPLSAEREALISGLRESAIIVESDGWAFGDELREAADMLTSDAHHQEPHGWMIQGSSSVARGDFAEEDAIAEAKRIGGTCYAYPIYLKL